MAIEIVDFPIKNGPFSIAMIVYQRVSQTEEFFWGGWLFNNLLVLNVGNEDEWGNDHSNN